MQAPLVLFGSGRCGSTVLHQMLSRHPGLAWIPEHLGGRALSSLPDIRRFLRWMDVPGVGHWLQWRHRPGEVYGLWESLAPGFGEPGRDLLAADADQAVVRRVRDAFDQMVTPRRHRVLLKITGWPRLGFLNAVFPGAQFVHVTRDPRAIACSFLRVPWWRGREGPEQWRWGALSGEQRELWERHGRTPLALACLQMHIYRNALERAVREIPDADARIHEVRYGTLCADSESVLDGLLRWSGLSWSGPFRRAVRRTRLVSTEDAWSRHLRRDERRVVESLLGRDWRSGCSQTSEDLAPVRLEEGSPR